MVFLFFIIIVLICDRMRCISFCSYIQDTELYSYASEFDSTLWFIKTRKIIIRIYLKTLLYLAHLRKLKFIDIN